MPKIIALASLYMPLEFIEDRINNLNKCNMDGVCVWWIDVSPKPTWNLAKDIISKCKFEHRMSHNNSRQTLYWAWNWVIRQSKNDNMWPSYFCNTNVDDMNHPDYFQIMSGYLDSHKDKNIVCCDWYNTNVKHQNSWPPKHDSISVVEPRLTLGHFPMWRASLHDTVGLFDGRMICIGDADFWARIKQKHTDSVIGKIAQPLGCYLSHQNNLYYKGVGPNGQSGEGHDRSLMNDRKKSDKAAQGIPTKRRGVRPARRKK